MKRVQKAGLKIGKFEITKDAHGWTLTETKMGRAGTKKDAPPKEQKKERYFANLEQCCHRIIDLSAPDAATAQEVIDAIKSAEKAITAAIKEAK